MSNPKHEIHIMIDLETLSTQHNAHILSVGACVFDSSGVYPEEFYHKIDPTVAQAGRHVSKDTMAWWDKQDEVAREEAFSGRELLIDILTGLSRWIKQIELSHPMRDMETGKITYPEVFLWSKGAQFDLCILNDAYGYRGIETPWNFWNEMCFRTLEKQFPGITIPPLGKEQKHNALLDAKYQAVKASMILKAIEEYEDYRKVTRRSESGQQVD